MLPPVPGDDAVSEIIGFVLAFALSAVFLLLSLNAFYGASENSDAVVAAVELKAIAERVGTRIVELGLASQDHPNATMNVTLDVPALLAGRDYYIEARANAIYVNSTDGVILAEASTLKLEAVKNVVVGGKALSSNERLMITSSPQPTARHIMIHEV